MLLLPGQPSYPELLLETRGKGKINNEMRAELNPVVAQASIALWSKHRPDARLRSITGTYNCVGMVVASRRTWVDPEDLLRILREDGYRPLASEADTRFGDIVVYRDQKGDVSHVGIVVRKNPYNPENPRDVLVILSKWGHEGEYEHDATHVPMVFGKPAEYWSDRKGVAP